MMGIVERLLSRFKETLYIVKRKRKCKWKGCKTILSSYDHHKYCFFHYDLIPDKEKYWKRRYAEGKKFKTKHRRRISKSIKEWWNRRKNGKKNVNFSKS